MYIEIWQLGMVGVALVSAFFSYRQGRIDGVQTGMRSTITDLYSKGIVSIYQDAGEGEMVVGRYDEQDWKETIELGEDDDDDEENWW